MASFSSFKEACQGVLFFHGQEFFFLVGGRGEKSSIDYREECLLCLHYIKVTFKLGKHICRYFLVICHSPCSNLHFSLPEIKHFWCLNTTTNLLKSCLEWPLGSDIHSSTSCRFLIVFLIWITFCSRKGFVNTFSQIVVSFVQARCCDTIPPSPGTEVWVSSQEANLFFFLSCVAYRNQPRCEWWLCSLTALKSTGRESVSRLSQTISFVVKDYFFWGDSARCDFSHLKSPGRNKCMQVFEKTQ